MNFPPKVSARTSTSASFSVACTSPCQLLIVLRPQKTPNHHFPQSRSRSVSQKKCLEHYVFKTETAQIALGYRFYIEKLREEKFNDTGWNKEEIFWYLLNQQWRQLYARWHVKKPRMNIWNSSSCKLLLLHAFDLKHMCQITYDKSCTSKVRYMKFDCCRRWVWLGRDKSHQFLF